jgi:hypothetical protein
MNPKPLVKSKSGRHERRKTVTLIAGMVCHGGIVFAADSEESGVIRKSVEKVSTNKKGFHRLEEALGGVKHSSLIVAGAGNGTLADYATQRIIEEAKYLQDIREVEKKIVEILREIHTINVPLHPVSDPRDADIELLIGVKSPKWPTPVLYSTQGVTVVKRDTYFVCGSGALIEYILDQVYRQGMPYEDGISAALYMLQLAKQYVGGVGGESQIVVLGADGEVTPKPSWEISEEENMAKQFSLMAGRLLLSTMRTRTESGDESFNSSLKEFVAQVRASRKRKRKSDRRMDDYRARIEAIRQGEPPDDGETGELVKE